MEVTPAELAAPLRRAPDAAARRSCATSTASPGSGAAWPTRSATGPSSRRSRRPASSALDGAEQGRGRHPRRGRRGPGLRAQPTRHELVRRPARPACTSAPGEPCPVCGDTIREVEYSQLHGQLLPHLPDRRQGAGRQHHQPLPQVAGRAPAPDVRRTRHPGGFVRTSAGETGRSRRARHVRSGPCRSTCAPSRATTPLPSSCPGDPRRATYIAETFLDPGARCVNEERGMLGYTGTFEGRPLSVQSTGMGCPSAAIVVEELVQLGATRLVRVGTCGGLQPAMHMADTGGGRWRPRPRTGRSSPTPTASPTRRPRRWTLVERGRRARPRAGRAAPRRSDRLQRRVLRPRPEPVPPLAGAGPPGRRDGGRRALHDRRHPPGRGAWPS